VAHVCGLGHLLNRKHVRRTLESITRYNGQRDLYAHFNHMRTFAINDEPALLMCSYPRGGRPRTPVPYCNEVMSGFEYAAAVHMLYEGLVDQGLAHIGAVRARYDGLKRNPFDEAECGHHYARAMASWGAVLALSGFRYSAVTQTVTLAPREGMCFWSNGYAWGTYRIKDKGDCFRVKLQVLHGTLALRALVLCGYGQSDLGYAAVVHESEGLTFRITPAH
jgi:non-lysosomal glucosylceramidase